MDFDIDRNAPAVGSGEIRIGASPEVVWDVIADIEHWPGWNQDIASASLEGDLVEGTTFRWKSGRSTITSTLRVVDPPRRLGWTGRTLGITAIHDWRLEPADGGTLVRTDESWGGLLARLFSGYSRKTIEKAIASGLGYLKVEAERRAGT